MSHHLLIAPSNLQFFIADPQARDVPLHGEQIEIIATDEMISVPCRYLYEGDTDLTVGTFAEVAEPTPPRFDKIIRTPSRLVEFTELGITVLLSYPTMTEFTRVRIWTDGLMLAEKVVVAIGD